jgi:hypothetical protein
MSDIISITRPNASSPVSQPQKVDTKFPTEIINLPSKGWFYPPESPLSDGTIEIKMMTAKEEDILTSRNLIQKNIVLDKLLESVIIDKRINADDIFIGDRNAAFFAIRRLAYGDEYNATITCGRCSKENSLTIDLSKMDNLPFDFEKFPRGENKFEFRLPISGKTVTYKLLSKKDRDAIDQELTGLQKISKDFTKETTTRLSHIITSIDGSDEKVAIRRFVNEQLTSKDSLALRKDIKLNTPDINTEFDFVCAHCGLERKEEMPMGISFFWPSN